MAAPSTAELLDQVRQAISDLVTAGVASFGEAGETYTHLDLGRLREMEMHLSARLASESGGNFRLGRFQPRR